MARAKKEPRKWTNEERAIDVWNQQVFFLKKQFPDADRIIQKIQKQHMPKKKGEDFVPNGEATEALRELYLELKGTTPTQTPQPFGTS